VLGYGAAEKAETPSRLPPVGPVVVVGEQPPSPPAADPVAAAPATPGSAAPGVAAPPAPPPVDQQILEEARRKAQLMLQQAQEQIQQAMEQAQQQAQKLFEQARAQGFEQGKQEGLAAGRQELAAAFDEVREVYKQVLAERQKILDAVEPQVARLALKVAEKIIGQEVKASGDSVVGVVRQAMAGLGTREEVKIRIHPHDYPAVDENRKALERLVEGLKLLEVVSDPRIEQGSCVLETNLGNVDARISVQLEALAQAFEKVAQGEEEGTGDEPQAL
jgi:flagellar assembly protein FliH